MKDLSRFWAYIGDGRLKTDRGLSTINTNLETIKFFIKWLKQYFNAKIEDIKVNIFLPRSDFNVNFEKRKWSKLFRVNINSVKSKYKYKGYHKIGIEVGYFRAISKLILNKLIPVIKKECLINKSFATAYLKGIMAAEGSLKYNKKSHHRSVHLKMKDKTEVRYVFHLLRFMGLTPSFLFSKQDKEWLVMINGCSELEELNEMDIFELNSERKEKFKQILSICHHKQVKKRSGEKILPY